VVVGLVVGKTVGVTAFAWVATRTGITRLPDGVRWSHLLGVAALAGIGFTVSLFIGSIAFSGSDEALREVATVSVLAGSVIAAAIGSVWLTVVARRAEVSR
jgi:NhaA family Na+:H+ antiporter